jgi:hypothetical protein
LSEVADHLIGHFVDQARSGASWTDIGESMGVTKQARPAARRAQRPGRIGHRVAAPTGRRHRDPARVHHASTGRRVAGAYPVQRPSAQGARVDRSRGASARPQLRRTEHLLLALLELEDLQEVQARPLHRAGVGKARVEADLSAALEALSGGTKG